MKRNQSFSAVLWGALALFVLCMVAPSCQAVKKCKVAKMQKHQDELLASDEYKALLPVVQHECDSLFVVFRLEMLEGEIERARDDISEVELEKKQQVEEARKLLYEAGDAAAAINVLPPLMGGSQWYWRTKKEIFKRYGIEWYTPQELNPGVIYD